MLVVEWRMIFFEGFLDGVGCVKGLLGCSSRLVRFIFGIKKEICVHRYLFCSTSTNWFKSSDVAFKFNASACYVILD